MKYLIFLIVGLLFLSCDKENVKTQEPNLLGTWELVEYEDENENATTIIVAPDSEQPIFITFMDAQFKGTTNANTFFGDYNVEPKLLTFKNFHGSEVGESEWGQKFYNSIQSTYDVDNNISNMNFIFEGDNFKIEYEPSQFYDFC